MKKGVISLKKGWHFSKDVKGKKFKMASQDDHRTPNVRYISKLGYMIHIKNICYLRKGNYFTTFADYVHHLHQRIPKGVQNECHKPKSLV